MIQVQAQAVLTDIEGTTTDIAFVHDTLFPYARQRIADYIQAHHAEAAVRQQIEATAELAGIDPNQLDAIAAQLERWIDEDEKITPLKALQGMLWKQGYLDGDFQGHVYSDAAIYLSRWHGFGVQLNVYSSGSEAAQKLIFGYSDHGDMRPLFSHYFDTRIGGKKEAQSYAKICQTLQVEPAQLLFLSDVVAELDAAREAGLQTIQLVRDPDMQTGDHPIAHQFGDIDLETTA